MRISPNPIKNGAPISRLRKASTLAPTMSLLAYSCVSFQTMGSFMVHFTRIPAHGFGSMFLIRNPKYPKKINSAPRSMRMAGKLGLMAVWSVHQWI